MRIENLEECKDHNTNLYILIATELHWYINFIIWLISISKVVHKFIISNSVIHKQHATVFWKSDYSKTAMKIREI